MRFALGTVQFGLEYGLANTAGKTTVEEANTIVELARHSGIDTIDTAIAYGDSETCLGKIGISDFRTISKLPLLPRNIEPIDSWVRNEVASSISRLNIRSLGGILLHATDVLGTKQGDTIWKTLEQLKVEGIIQSIGYSIYGPEELDRVFDIYNPDIVQAPYNIIDRRIEQSGWLEKLHKNSVEVHTRSVFLQGLLLMNARERPAKFEQWSELWMSLEEWQKDTNLTAISACLNTVVHDDRIHRVVIGVETAKQLEEILLTHSIQHHNPPDTITSEDVLLINPSNWNAL